MRLRIYSKNQVCGQSGWYLICKIYLVNKEAIMDWDVIRKGEPDSTNIKNFGICMLYAKQAEVTSFFRGTIECRTDLQKTYRFKGYKCSLQETSYPHPACMDSCPLIQKKY